MTGFATSSLETEAGTITVELKSVNSRFLDLQFRINDDFRAVESVFRELISGQISRGKVECRFSFGKKAASGQQKNLNQEALQQLRSLEQQIAALFPHAQPLTAHDILRWPGVMEEQEISGEALQPAILQTIQQALALFKVSREREGEALTAVLLSKIAAMDEIVERITPLMPQVLQQFQQKATSRLEEALGFAGTESTQTTTTITRDEALDRIRQEVTLYGVKIDVAEELARLGAHLKETRHILKKGGPVGKRLDFMMQELNREANTLGSKAAIKDLADASMELKLLIEQMREQVQNLE
ncbi:YicC family protein [Undibacterium sp. LFS511W]|uniref:YicC family protein n=2 Tax=Undibacterium luofuense TaxID=2828733 RepID=A0A941DQ08_9BURK|nr:YicC family protein [Undibacterium luofuense]